MNKKSRNIAMALCSLSCWYQVANAQIVPGADAQMQGGTVKGKVVDANGKAVNGASVYLLKIVKDSVSAKSKAVLLKNVATTNTGDFEVDDVPLRGAFKIKISMVGYNEKDTIASFSKEDFALFTKNMGNLSLSLAPTDQLADVVVSSSSSTPAVKMDIDKKTFDVTKNLTTTGGTALDVLKNVPSVNVDIDGNITMRNASPQLYLDGRPTTLTVDQIPADAIQSVEVITNPSAKYDASGGNAGILNIVLKKNKKIGYNGNLSAGVDRNLGKNLGANLNLKQGKFNFSFNGMYNQHKDRMNGKVERTNTYDDYDSQIQQFVSTKDRGAFAFGRLGIDYFLNDNNTISMTGTKMHGSMRPYGVMDFMTDTLVDGVSTRTYPSFSRRYTSQSNQFNGNGLTLSYKHLFKNPEQNITFDGNYFGGNMKSNSLYTTNGYSGENEASAISGTSLQNITANGKMSHLTLQTDYTMPVGKEGKFEAGLRANMHTNNVYNLNKTASSADVADLTTRYVTNYKSNDQTYAAYATFTNKIGKTFGYQVGLRAEKYNYSGNLLTTNAKFGRHFPLNFFPTVYLTQDLGKGSQLQFTVTRRVNRPSFFQLMPITDYSDSLNIKKGNPNLVPEYTNKIELGYSKSFDKNNVFMASVYYSHTDHLITSYIDSATNELTGNTDYITSYVNANSSYNTGVEFTTTNKVNKWWSLNGNVNLYRSKINTSNISTTYTGTSMWSWYAKMNNTFTLPVGFTMQLSGNYQSKTNLPISSNQDKMGPPGGSVQSAAQGYISPFWTVDAALKRDFLKSKALSATLAFSDIFRSGTQRQYSEGTGFTQYYSRLRNPQFIRFTIAYKFGKFDASLFKKKSTKGDNSSGSEMLGS